MAEPELPHATWSGSFHLFGVDLKCHVLSDGRRIIETESLEAFFEAMADPKSPAPTDEEIQAFARWQKEIS